MSLTLCLRLPIGTSLFGALFFFLQVTLAIAEPAISVDKNALAIDGYDPVAYFVEGKPALGTAQISHTWKGAVWHFANVDNREKFASNPEKFAPQYGGYCAYAMSGGGFAAGDGERWRIVEDKLYLNNNWLAQKLWNQNIPENIQDADGHWPKLAPKLDEGKS